MASLGLPFQGRIWYYIESSYGSGPSDIGQLPISTKVLDARPGVGDKHKKIRGIDAPEADLLEQCTDETFHLEYIPQVGDTLFEDAVIRGPSDCALESICFVLETNTCLGADQSIYIIQGAKNKSCRVSSSHNTEYVYVMDFSVKSIITETSMPTELSEPTDLAGALCAFNIAGSITKDAVDFAYILNSIDITIDNGVKDKWDHDSLEKQFAIESELNVEGSVDISLDEGDAAHFAEVLAQDDFEIIINLGGAGAPKITLSHCKWKSNETDVNTSGDDIKESAPFTGTTIAYGTV
jgi:hypothetical protein